jgi:hypothetical protein
MNNLDFEYLYNSVNSIMLKEKTNNFIENTENYEVDFKKEKEIIYIYLREKRSKQEEIKENILRIEINKDYDSIIKYSVKELTVPEIDLTNILENKLISVYSS